MTAARLDYGRPLTQDFGFDGGEWRRARRTRPSAISRVVPLRRRAPPIVSGSEQLGAATIAPVGV